MKNKGFTLIELIVVITILAILGTIAFIGFKGYTSDARDSKITADIANLHNSLAILKATEGILPMPDNAKTVTAGTTELTFEGEVGGNVRNVVKASSDMKTPAGDNYKYAVTKDQKDFTLVGLLENETAKLGTKVFAYSDANVKYFKGDDVLTLFDVNNNFKHGDVLDLKSGEEVYSGENKRQTEGTSIILENCKQIKDFTLTADSGIYKIVPNGEVMETYCDMVTDGGGWTVIASDGLTEYTDILYNTTTIPSPTEKGLLKYFIDNRINDKFSEMKVTSLKNASKSTTYNIKEEWIGSLVLANSEQGYLKSVGNGFSGGINSAHKCNFSIVVHNDVGCHLPNSFSYPVNGKVLGANSTSPAQIYGSMQYSWQFVGDEYNSKYRLGRVIPSGANVYTNYYDGRDPSYLMIR